MFKDDWEELVAQVETHGPENIKFKLLNIDDFEVTGVMFEGNFIVVQLAAT